jgi:hypothetical protein
MTQSGETNPCRTAETKEKALVTKVLTSFSFKNVMAQEGKKSLEKP